MAMDKPLSLVITCDDGALSPGVDDAVIELYQDGMVSSVSVMTNMPDARTSLERFNAYPDLESGGHLKLTEGRPLTEGIHQSWLSIKECLKGVWFVLCKVCSLQTHYKLSFMMN